MQLSPLARGGRRPRLGGGPGVRGAARGGPEPGRGAGLPLDSAAGIGAVAFAGLILSTLPAFLGIAVGPGVVLALLGGTALAYFVAGPHAATRRWRIGLPLGLVCAGAAAGLVRLLLPGGGQAIAGYAVNVATQLVSWQASGGASLSPPAPVPVTAVLGFAVSLPVFVAARAGRPALALLLGFALLVIEWEFVDNATVRLFWPLVGISLFWLAADRARETALRTEAGVGSPTPWTAFGMAGLAGLLVLAALAVVPRQGAPANLGSLGVWIDQLPIIGSMEKATREGDLGFGPQAPSSGNASAPGPGGGGGSALRTGGFSLQQTGFSADVAQLGGPASPDNSVALQISVSGSGALPSILYLRGAVRDLYTGKGWLPDAEAQTADPAWASATAGQLGRDFLSGAAIPAPYTLLSAHIELEAAVSDNLFTALVPLRLPVADVTWDEAGEVWAPAVPVKGFGYDLTAAVLGPDVWDGTGLAAYTASSLGGRTVSPLQALDLAERGVTVLAEPGPGAAAAGGTLPVASDLQLPSTLPAAVGDLARTWTAGLGQDPLLEALAIQQHLKADYTYTLDAPAVPASQDFVSYFLFDSLRGYCTSFSSAMVVLLRTLGIPARWVEGYRVALPPQGGTFLVRDNAAHAWVEAYVAPYGWLTFDPTPAAPPAAQPATAAESRGIGARLGLLQDAAAARWWVLAGLPGALLVLLLGGAAANVLDEHRAAPTPGHAAQRVWRACERVGARYGRPRDRSETPAEYLAALTLLVPGGAAAAAGLAAEYGRIRFGAGEPEDVLWRRADRLRAHWTAMQASLRAAAPWTYPLRRWL